MTDPSDAGDSTEQPMPTPETTVATLLESVQAHHERRRKYGWNFNVFHLLELEGSEDALHSRVIADLLDRGGSHGQGDSFLELFLEKVGVLAWKDDSHRTTAKEWIEAGKATVVPEKSIGRVKIDGERSSGGRIDIFISDREHHLSIENKIWSGEGEKQVTRYCNYRPGRNFVLFLTLDGGDADTDRPNYRPISYVEHILPWLESCQRCAKDFPILRETIRQYITTVKRLTGGLAMDAEIRDAMKQHYRAAWEIRQTFDDLVSKQVEELVSQARNRIKGQAQQSGWGMEEEPTRLVLKSERWGRTQVILEYEKDSIWVGIHSPDKSLTHSDVRGRLSWPDPQGANTKNTEEPYWVWVRRESFFKTPEGIECLFNDFKHGELADDLKTKLVQAAECCDERLPSGSPH